MAVFQGEEEEERSQVGEYLPGILFHGQLLPGDGFSRSAVLVLLRRLLSFHTNNTTDRVRQLE